MKDFILTIFAFVEGDLFCIFSDQKNKISDKNIESLRPNDVYRINECMNIAILVYGMAITISGGNLRV